MSQKAFKILAIILTIVLFLLMLGQVEGQIQGNSSAITGLGFIAGVCWFSVAYLEKNNNNKQ
jgi:hypothetical protein